jgi:hypothetical protein
MIRHVSISEDDYVIAETPCFAWFDTVSKKFISVSGVQVWSTWCEFKKDWSEEKGDKYPIERFRELFPSK